jgi:serine phosphatase RsbU (regulator of sigma subunit)
VADTEHDPGEHFITALVLDIPDEGPDAWMITCGHPPPLLLRKQEVTALHPRHPLPPLGMCELPAASHRPDPFTFETGDILLLYTDGVIEARSPSGVFYPLLERVASFPVSSPDALMRNIHDDLLAHVGDHPGDDAALLIIERTASHHPHRPRFATRSVDGHHRLHPTGSPPSAER